jgi:BlaI family penicillinase repressor
MREVYISITESEWMVLKVLWEQAPLTLPQVAQSLEDTGWSISTIQTFLSRLVKKGAIATQKQGKGFLYSPIVSEQECQIEQIKRFVERVYNGSISNMVLGAIKSGNLTEDEFEKLKRLVTDHEKERKE